MDRTTRLYNKIISTFEDPAQVTVWVGLLPETDGSDPDSVVDRPLLINMLETFYGVGFHDHGDDTIHPD